MKFKFSLFSFIFSTKVDDKSSTILTPKGISVQSTIATEGQRFKPSQVKVTIQPLSKIFFSSEDFMFKGFELIFRALELLSKAFGYMFKALEHKIYNGVNNFP